MSYHVFLKKVSIPNTGEVLEAGYLGYARINACIYARDKNIKNASAYDLYNAIIATQKACRYGYPAEVHTEDGEKVPDSVIMAVLFGTE